jgi:protein SCO1
VRKVSLASYLLVGWLVAFLGWWYFALAPLPETTPQWVETARAVCFGSLPNGLPEGYGWITLVLSPLLMLTALAVIWAEDLGHDLQILLASSAGRVGLALLILVPFVSVNWGVARILKVQMASQQVVAPVEIPEDFPEAYPTFEGSPPAFRLLNQAGETVTLESLAGRRFLLTFAFANCSSTCPGLVYTVKEAAATARGERPAIVLVTLDPWRDTPGSLPSLAKKWELGEGDHVLSGEIPDVEGVARAYKVSTSRNLQNGDIVHSGVTFLFNEKGELVYQLNSPSVKWIKQALDRM